MANTIAFYVQFHVKPEFVEQWKESAINVINQMAGEETFVSCNMDQDADDPNKFSLYEVWNEPSREAFMENQLNGKAYRDEYEKTLPGMLQSPRIITFLDPLKEWHRA
jgi:quinol monooxygenase YgiN